MNDKLREWLERTGSWSSQGDSVTVGRVAILGLLEQVTAANRERDSLATLLEQKHAETTRLRSDIAEWARRHSAGDSGWDTSCDVLAKHAETH